MSPLWRLACQSFIIFCLSGHSRLILFLTKVPFAWLFPRIQPAFQWDHPWSMIKWNALFKILCTFKFIHWLLQRWRLNHLQLFSHPIFDVQACKGNTYCSNFALPQLRTHNGVLRYVSVKYELCFSWNGEIKKCYKRIITPKQELFWVR